ncbi:MAG TPA: ABC transporter substrate-binding protein, partial [Acidimicrobiia bacterium]|nr:ABC transporter substrate-binding protein [Acidimicrobiia bacterium]
GGRPLRTGDSPSARPPVPEGGPTPEGAEPVLIASVGTLSGPVGAAMQGGPMAVRVWARAVNAAGGLHGRPVQVVVADDGGDPYRYQALLRELVERRGVVAFVSNMAAFTLASGAAYLEARRVPVIGGDLTSAMWNESPMFFPQAGGEQALVWGMVANGAATGRRRFGSLACRESVGCTNAERYWFEEGWVAEAGMEPAYRGQISIAQPDYTAECLTAERAGVEVLAVVADGATARRVSVSCARQGYRPIFSIAGPAVDERLAGAGAAEALDGTLGTVVTFPYVVTGTPATDEFRSALARFGTGEPLSAAAAQGWVSAKLFERVARHAPALTPGAILDGLWSLSGETLGGITAPRTFVRDKRNPDLRCFFVMQLAGRSWTAPRGTDLVCKG